MIRLLPTWNVKSTNPSFYDVNSITMLELSATLQGKMNELITDYNNFVSEANKKISDFEYSTTEELSAFESSMRQEFQDFIDTINLKYAFQDQKMDHINSVFEAEEKKIQDIINKAIKDIDNILSSLLEAGY